MAPQAATLDQEDTGAHGSHQCQRERNGTTGMQAPSIPHEEAAHARAPTATLLRTLIALFYWSLFAATHLQRLMACRSRRIAVECGRAREACR